MKITKQARRDAKELFRSTFVNGVMDSAKVRQVVKVVLDQKPRGYIPILEHFQRLIKLEEDRRSARVESAIPLDAAQQQNIQSTLTRTYGPGLNIQFVQNPAVLGGLRVKVGSDVFDGSIQSRLQALAEAF
jgi:F-type H+-transporting ATPase subunit delta